MPKEYNIARTGGRCAACQRDMPAGLEFVATVRERDQEFRRADYCLSCWQRAPQNGPEVVGTWRSRVPAPQQKKRLFVDDEVLLDLFDRLGGEDDPARVRFRFVLALVLMRKKLLVYEGMERREGVGEVWRMRRRGAEGLHEVVDPGMDEQQIAEVSRQLDQIMEGQ